MLELLFNHGACANGHAPTYGDLLLEARYEKSEEMMELVDRYLAIQKNQGICPEGVREFSILEQLERKRVEDLEALDDLAQRKMSYNCTNQMGISR